MKDPDTAIGAGRSAFDRTHWSEVARAGAGNPAATAALAAAYWRPVYKFIRISLGKSNEEAKDLTQDFFATVFQPEWMARADERRGRFRSFLLTCVRHFVRDHERHRGAARRGGGARLVPLDGVDEDAAPAGGITPERAFHQAWAEALLEQALAELERRFAERGRPQVFRAFREYCLTPAPASEPSYAAVAERLGLTITEVTNFLSEARRRLREILAERIGETVTSPADVEAELKELFGA